MPDNILLIIFSTLTVLSLFIGGTALFFAMRTAKQKESELKMAFWACIALIGLTGAGMSLAYFIIPILLHQFF